MIFHDYKLIFVHIPKTGGSSIEHALAESLGIELDVTVDDKDLFTGWDDENYIWRQHATIEEVNNLYEGELNDYKSVAFTRNSWSRAVSDFLWLSRELNISEGVFVDYLTGEGKFKEALDCNNKQSSRRYDHVQPQSDFININNQPVVDYIGSFENIQHDFDVLCELIGVGVVELPHHKKSEYDKEYVDYYNEQTKQIVADMYEEDIKMFNYEFGE